MLQLEKTKYKFQKMCVKFLESLILITFSICKFGGLE